MTPAQHGPPVDIAIVIAAFIGISAVALKTQRAERLYADGQKYQAMSVQFYESRRPIVEEGPFVYRVAVPWLAATLRTAVERAFPAWHRRIDGEVGMSGIAPFFLINVAAALCASVLLLLYVQRFVAGPLIPAVLVTAWMATWHVPVRFTYFDPVNVDAVFFVCLLAALLLIEHTRDRAAFAVALALMPIVFVGALVRESMILVPLAFAVAHGARVDSTSFERIAGVAVTFAAWAAALVFARHLAVSNPTYDPLVEPMTMIREKPLFTWALAWFFTFGPAALAFVAAGHREVAAFFRTRPELAVVVASCGVLAFFGGTDTERILAWAAPPLYAAVGRVMSARLPALGQAPVLTTLLAVVQIVSSRVLWPIPVGIDHVTRAADLSVNWASVRAVADKFLVIHNYYSNLWSFFGSRPVHAVTLLFDLLITAAFALSIERVRRRYAWQ